MVMIYCGAVDPGDSARTCMRSPEKPHAQHSWWPLGGDPERDGMFWTNGEYVEPQPSVRGSRKRVEQMAGKRLSEMEDRIHRVTEPEIPIGTNHPETSHEMARNELPKVGDKLRTVYEVISWSGAEGLNDTELEYVTGWEHETVSSLRNTLMKRDLIMEQGTKRLAKKNPGNVWCLPEHALPEGHRMRVKRLDRV